VPSEIGFGGRAETTQQGEDKALAQFW